jgi:hypothetical protein
MDGVGRQLGRAMAQAGSRRLVTAEVLFRARVSPCGIYGQSGIGTDFSPSSSFSLSF